MKRVRANINQEIVQKFFNNLESVIRDISPQNIMNYDESAFQNDPGKEHVLVRRGMKYPAVLRESSKVSVSVMACGTASGILLPPYVVYKSSCMWSTWLLDGLHRSRYNTKSGWFDLITFEDWFFKVALRYLRRLSGKKLIIGDNLGSHLSFRVIKACERHNISFVLLPPNSTHILQLLDVAVFHPLKLAWRAVLVKWQTAEKSTEFKENVPRLIRETLESVGSHGTQNMISGFRACGIYPFDPQQALKRLPAPERQLSTPTSSSTSSTSGSVCRNTCACLTPIPCRLVLEQISSFEKRLKDVLQKERFGQPGGQKTRKKKINVSPGKSMRGIHFGGNKPDTSSEDESEVKDNFDTDFVVLPENDVEPVPAEKDVTNEIEISEENEKVDRVETVVQQDSTNNTQPIPVQDEDIKKDAFVIVHIPYTTGSSSSKKTHFHAYVGKIHAVKARGKDISVLFMRKYLNRSNEFVFITPDEDMEPKPESVHRYDITHVLAPPVKVSQGRYTFNMPKGVL